MRRTGIQANRCGGGHVERLFSARLGDAHQQMGALGDCSLHALPFVPQHPGAGVGQHSLVQQLLALQVRDKQGHLQTVQSIRRQAFKQTQAKMRAHARTQHLVRPQRRRAFERKHLPKAQGTGAAQNGANIACILNAVENDGVGLGVKGFRFVQERRAIDHKPHA